VLRDQLEVYIQRVEEFKRTVMGMEEKLKSTEKILSQFHNEESIKK